MSIHLLLIAGYLPRSVVTPSQKLALMKICDSADEETRLSRPGLHRLVAWTGVGEKRTITLVTELVEKGLVERVKVGMPGQTAVYRAFPLGVPDLPVAAELHERRQEAATAPRNPNLARTGVSRAKPAAPARTYLDVMERERQAAERRGFPQGNPPEEPGQVPPGEPAEFPRGNPGGSERGTPFIPSTTSVTPTPLPPTADAAGDGAPARPCARHKRIAKNCRACGTSSSAQRAAGERQQAERARQAERAWMDGFRQDVEAQRQSVESNPAGVASARKAAYDAVRAARRPAGDDRATGVGELAPPTE
ncbi:hypothetical protein ACIQ9P_03755 [Kitasatospora sp. NPDC094019]|uniref:hypothetical protein n=1 Tax=Kitasatospora sp. NPDC094019 TaxID=3364091 RepID=UPI00381C9DAC